MRKFDYNGGALASSAALAAAVIVAELFPPFKNFLTATFSHHWIGKTAIVIAFFVVGGYTLKASEKKAWYGALASLAAMLMFFVLHYVL